LRVYCKEHIDGCGDLKKHIEKPQTIEEAACAIVDSIRRGRASAART
jgi:hypothetical protein